MKTRQDHDLRPRACGFRRVGRMLAVGVVLCSLSVLSACGSSDDAGKKFDEVTQKLDELSGTSDELDELRARGRERIDEEKDALAGRVQEQRNDLSARAESLTPFCSKANEYEAELAQDSATSDQRRLQIYEELRADAPAELGEALDVAINALQLNQTDPNRLDAQRPTLEINNYVVTRCR